MCNTCDEHNKDKKDEDKGRHVCDGSCNHEDEEEKKEGCCGGGSCSNC